MLSMMACGRRSGILIVLDMLFLTGKALPSVAQLAEVIAVDHRIGRPTNQRICTPIIFGELVLTQNHRNG
jgi:hypothetical protein